MTCNPNWPEISEQLTSYESSWERAEIVVRAIYVKLKHLLDLLLNSNILGEIIALIYTIEF